MKKSVSELVTAAGRFDAIEVQRTPEVRHAAETFRARLAEFVATQEAVTAAQAARARAVAGGDLEAVDRTSRELVAARQRQEAAEMVRGRAETTRFEAVEVGRARLIDELAVLQREILALMLGDPLQLVEFAVLNDLLGAVNAHQRRFAPETSEAQGLRFEEFFFRGGFNEEGITHWLDYARSHLETERRRVA